MRYTINHTLPNIMTSITHGAIALGPTGNLNETYTLFHLKNGFIVKRCKSTEYPIPKQVINTVNMWEGGVQENIIWGQFGV